MVNAGRSGPTVPSDEAGMVQNADSRGGPLDWLVLAAFAGGCVVLGWLSSLAQSAASQAWYDALQRPALTPPDWTFGAVWTLLYGLMGAAAWLVWRRRTEAGAPAALILFAVQLVLNLIWTPAFFGLQSVALGFIVIVPVLIAVLATTVAFWRVSRPAGLLFLPYLAWVAFATLLAWQIWQLNA